MHEKAKLIIFSRGDVYSVTECSNSGIRKALLNNGLIIGDSDLIDEVGRMKYPEETIEDFLKRKSGYLVPAEPQEGTAAI
jgi:hypothetical protein